MAHFLDGQYVQFRYRPSGLGRPAYPQGEEGPSSETGRTQLALALFLNSRLLKEVALKEKVERGLGTHLTATEADFPECLSRGDMRHATSQLLKIHSNCKKPSEKHNILIDEINTPVHAR